MYSRHNEFFYRYETLFACVVELFQLVCNVVGYSLALLTVSSHTRAGDESRDVDRVLDRDQITRRKCGSKCRCERSDNFYKDYITRVQPTYRLT